MQVDENADELLNSSKFLDIGEVDLEKILRRDSLAASEITVYNSAVRWAVAKLKKYYNKISNPIVDFREKCPIIPHNIRLRLGELIYLIRFPAMPMKEFANGPDKCGVLTETVGSRLSSVRMPFQERLSI